MAGEEQPVVCEPEECGAEKEAFSDGAHWNIACWLETGQLLQWAWWARGFWKGILFWILIWNSPSDNDHNCNTRELEPAVCNCWVTFSRIYQESQPKQSYLTHRQTGPKETVYLQQNESRNWKTLEVGKHCSLIPIRLTKPCPKCNKIII